jgi:dTMP kinase
MFIVLEGIDYSGKSTQAKMLYERLSKESDVVATFEPTDGSIGKMIRLVLRHELKLDNMSLQALFVADRAEHIKSLIEPMEKEKKIIVCDRYFFSTFAYGAASNLDVEWLKAMNSKFPVPDITFFIKVDPAEAIKRMESKVAKADLFEKKEILEKVSLEYESFAKEYKNYFVIDGNKSIGEISDAIYTKVKEFLRK